MYSSLRNGRIIESVRQIQNGIAAQQRLFVIILNINVEDMHGPIERVALVHEVVDDGIPAALFTGDDHIDDA